MNKLQREEHAVKATDGSGPAEKPLGDRRAVVTGGARGIGLAIARRLLEHGARVLIVDCDRSELSAAEAALAEFGTGRIAAFCGDVGSESAVLALADAVDLRFDGTDILVNNAAILDCTPLEELSRETLTRVFDVNLFGAIACIRALLPALKRSKYPRIVNISSVNGLRGTADSVAYNASKAALIGLTQSMTIDLAPFGVSVNAVAPGFVDTRMSKLPDGSSEYDTDWFKQVYLKYGRLPMRRPATPIDIAGPVAFLCSDDARYINGQVIVVDGGVTACL